MKCHSDADKEGRILPSDLSPCTKQCKVKNKICIGCLRTLDEIIEWRELMAEDRMELMRKLSGQNRTHNCPGCEGPAYCAMEAGKSSSTCWCMGVEVKTTPEVDDGEQKCYCRSCLAKM